MATSNAKAAAPKWESVTPPTMKRGKGAQSIPKEVLEALYAELSKSGAATDGQLYDTRVKARGKAEKYRAALLREGLAEKGAVKTRVWPEDEDKREGPSRFALVLATAKE